MNDQVSFTLRGRNPDVLTCIANLSNDEVFTPPEFANQTLPASLVKLLAMEWELLAYFEQYRLRLAKRLVNFVMPIPKT